nr:hypothetical protein [Tanacetum cinerariifolium]
MVAFLSKSDARIGSDQIVDFLNAHTIQYTLAVNPNIYVSCIKQFWATATIKKVNDVVLLCALIEKKKVVVIRRDLCLDDADGVECFPNKEIFAELACMGYEKPPPKLTFYKAFFSVQWKFLIHTLVQCVSAKRTTWNEFSCSMASAVICLATVDDLTSHNTKCSSLALIQKVFANMRRVVKGFSGILFSSMSVQPLPQVAEEEEEVEIPTTPAQPSPTSDPSPPPHDPTPTPHATPPQIVLWVLRRMHPNRGKIEDIDADKDITLVDVETQVDMDAELQGRIDQVDEVNAASKGVNVVEPAVFDDEEVTMTINQDEKAKLLDEQIAQRLHDEKVKKAAARDKQENGNLERAQVLQKWKYQSLKKKPVSIAQARKNMTIYLKNMVGYKMENFRGVTYDKIRPIFEREYKLVQTLFKPDKDVEEPKKKRVAEETLLQGSFKKLKAVEVLGSESTQETPSNDPKEISEEDVQNMLEIVLVSEFKVKALKVTYPIIDWEIHSEGSRTYWKIIRVGGITEAYQSFGFDREDVSLEKSNKNVIGHRNN